MGPGQTKYSQSKSIFGLHPERHRHWLWSFKHSYSRQPHDFCFQFAFIVSPYIMQPSNAVRGYSEFFKSGFRAFTRGQTSSSSHNYLSGSPDPMYNASSLTPKSNYSGATKGRPRPVSVIVQNTPREKARRRRSSILSFTSQLSATTTSSFDERSMTSSTGGGPISPVFDSGDSLPEVWITAGGPFTQSARNGR